ncbi:glycine-rich cell wall structural protein 1.0 isoform X6 [Mugil cephalus]|uniref:glycine-rich cell wall structural protein 1.0 isoform X6 n=1 Tax=Mugil cephalus TaxID=48193 RepID=UPI001FB71687|nr:glycine-rich cell wall structural protein 1.0 isoform X6 [Mugil cephalus]
MLVQALLQTSLVLWLAQQTLQGGVKPQGVSWGRVLPARGVGIGVKPGVGGALGALGSRYGSKAMKSGPGQYPGAQHGVGGYGALGLGGRAGLKQGGYGNQGPYGASLGTANGLGLGYGQGGKPYGAGHGNLPAYGPLAGIGHPGARPGVFPGYPTGKGATKHKPGYFGGAGNYMGAGLGAGGFGAGLGQGAYLGGAAGKHGAAALGQGGYPQGVAGKSTGYGDGAAGHLGAMAGNGFGYGNGYSDGYGAGLGYPAELADVAEGKTGKREGAFGAGLEPTGGKYGGAAQSPYGNVPVIPAGLEGDGSYPYAAQHLSLGAEGTKTANKYGYGAHLGPPQDALAFTGEQTGKYGGANGNGYKG